MQTRLVRCPAQLPTFIRLFAHSGIAQILLGTKGAINGFPMAVRPSKCLHKYKQQR